MPYMQSELEAYAERDPVVGGARVVAQVVGPPVGPPGDWPRPFPPLIELWNCSDWHYQQGAKSAQSFLDECRNAGGEGACGWNEFACEWQCFCHDDGGSQFEEF